jgi:glutathione S-transferase
MNAPETFQLSTTREIRAPREHVFDAFVTDSLMRRWMCPRGMTIAAVSVQARLGGSYQLEMRSREGTPFVVGGNYREFDRPNRLAYTWRWQSAGMGDGETLVEVDFASVDGGTEVRMRHSGFKAAAERDGHEQGWGSCINRLTELLDARGSAATVTLLGDARSTYTRTVRMALAEKGVAYTMQVCAPNSPELLAVHPFGRIPALRDGEIALYETSAIVRYVDEAFEGPSLNPATILDRVRGEQWVSAVNCYLYDAMVRRYVLQYFFPRGEGGKPDRGVIDKALPEVARQLALLDATYRRGDFLAGAAPTYADLFVAPILSYVAAMPEGGQLLSDAPNVKRTMGVMQRRASFTGTDPQRAA